MEDKRLFNLLKKTLTKLSILIGYDHIVASGTSGMWHYEKRASGKAVLKGSAVFPSAAFAATGNVYYRNLGTLTFPTGFFIKTPHYINVASTMGNVGAAAYGDLSQTNVVVSVISAVSRARPVTIMAEVEGYWKTPVTIGGGVLHKKDFRRWQLCDCLTF